LGNLCLGVQIGTNENSLRLSWVVAGSELRSGCRGAFGSAQRVDSRVAGGRLGGNLLLVSTAVGGPAVGSGLQPDTRVVRGEGEGRLRVPTGAFLTPPPEGGCPASRLEKSCWLGGNADRIIRPPPRLFLPPLPSLIVQISRQEGWGMTSNPPAAGRNTSPMVPSA